MRPAVVTAVLLLVGVLDAVTAQQDLEFSFCENVAIEPCDDGWSDIGNNRCAQVITTKKTFQDAEDHCKNDLESNLASAHSEEEMIKMSCLTEHTDPDIETVWIGGERSGETFTFLDGSDFYEYGWNVDQPDNAGGHQDCIEMDIESMGFWNDEDCSEEKSFVCAKEKATS